MTACLVDTNILREFYAVAPHAGVKAWFEKQKIGDLYIATFNIAEIQYGVDVMADGKKKKILQNWLDDLLIPNFEGRILTFDIKAARIWAALQAKDRKKGRPRPVMDAILAAIALSSGLAIATRNVKDFESTGLKIINPFED